MKLRVLFTGLFALGLLFGCQNPMMKEGREPDTDQRQRVEPTRFGDDRESMDRSNRMSRTREERGNRQARDHNRYDVAKEAAEKITSEVDEVDRAYVLTTNNNAYVAIVLDDDRRDRTGTNRRNIQDRTDQGNLGDMDRQENRGTNRTDQSRRGTADNDLHNRTFIGRDDNISEQLKREVADIVRSVDRNIDNVYVSSNPDFIDLTNNYIDDIDNNRPIRGFFDEMGNMIERIFPQNR